ncbi:hypothetical protein Sjap_008257 [Stephania japonica]|uniref:Uncharacterized protein n=1 Tax=Stephania japonica TaxID=461633 RepID=A0AAP0PAP2_9MAGN
MELKLEVNPTMNVDHLSENSEKESKGLQTYSMNSKLEKAKERLKWRSRQGE